MGCIGGLWRVGVRTDILRSGYSDRNGLYRRTVRTVQYNHTYSTWNNIFCGTLLATRDQRIANSKRQAVHTIPMLTKAVLRFSLLVIFVVLPSSLASSWEDRSFSCFLIGRLGYTGEPWSTTTKGSISSACSNRSLRRVPGGPKLAGKTRRKPINKYERIKNIVYTAL